MPRTHRPYDEEFKRRAVELYLKSDQSLKQVARELGISDGSLRKWRMDLLGNLSDQQGKSRPLGDPEEMAREIRRLNRENAYLRRQREILKKAASIMAKDPKR